MRFIIRSAAIPSAALAVALAFAAGAQTQEPEEIVEELVEDSHVDEDGLVQAATGGAEPDDSWLGCPPDSDAPEDCEAGGEPLENAETVDIEEVEHPRELEDAAKGGPVTVQDEDNLDSQEPNVTIARESEDAFLYTDEVEENAEAIRADD
jgi:hypothetical protein